MRPFISLVVVLAATQLAGAGPMQITEWMYQGANGEFVEFTNTGSTPVDMTGWSYDDDSAVPGTISLSGFGVVMPGQSVIMTESDPAAFRAAWGLSGVAVVSNGTTANLNRNDVINLFDNTGLLVDTLAYGDQTYPGTVRTQAKSCNIPAGDYGFTTAQTTWVLATVGDVYGSWASAGGDIGSPGRVPEPSTLVFLALGAIALHRRWQ